MSRADELRLMTRVAQLYHVEGLKQAAISERLHISQARTSRLLARATEEGIVRITVVPPNGIYDDLERELRRKYGMREVIVAECAEDRDETIMAAIGAAAAAYLEATMADAEMIGVSSWSTSLLRAIDSLTPIRRARAAGVVQLLGGIGNAAVQSHAAHMINRLAQLTGGTPHFLPAQGVAASIEAHAVMMADPFVAEAIELFPKVTMALVGIGSLTPSRMLENSGNAFTRDELDVLGENGAVGDICLRFFDANGRSVVSPLDGRVIGIPLDRLGACRRVVAVAGGRRKIAAIRAAMLGRFLNVLITDRFTAERLAEGGPRPVDDAVDG